MIKNIIKISLLISIGLVSCLVPTYAASPTISISPTGDGNTVTVSIANADGNTPVVLFYNSALYTGTQSTTIGNTNSLGTFSGNISTSAYGITNNTQVYALVNGYQTPNISWPYNTSLPSSSSAVTFSQTNPTITQGQSITLTVNGGNGGYYISSNSNQASVQSSISGNLLTVSGSQTGSATITVCSSGNTCASQVITVTNGISNTNSVYVTQNNMSVTVGQSSQVVVAGGTAPYSIFYDGANKITATVTGTIVTITGIAAGNTSVTVCAVSGGCAPIAVTVVQNSNPSAAVLINIPVAVGQTLSLPLSGGSGTFYISTPITIPFKATISGNNLSLMGTAVGSNAVTVCSNSTACSSINVVVNAGLITTPPTTSIGSATKYIFDNPLYSGMSGDEVLKLQERLVEESYLNATPNGYYGQATIAAVKAFQRDHGLSPLGNVGPGTRAALNK